MPPSISFSGNQANQRITDQSTIVPFAGATLADDIGQTETMTVTLSVPGNGTLSNCGSGSYNPLTGLFTDSGSVNAVTADLDGLTFTPTPEQVAPGQTVTTTFSISDSNGAGASTSDSSTSVIATAVAVAPTVSNTVANQAATDHTSIAPFAWVVIADPNIGQTETVTVKLSAAGNGRFTNLGSGSYDPASGSYTDQGSAAAITGDLEALLFVPTQGQIQLGQTVTTRFTIQDVSTAGTSATDGTTSVIATSVTLPTISNTMTGQAVSDQTTIAPFAAVVIADSNAGQTQTVTVTLSAANGSLTNVGGGYYNFLTGVYTDSGSAGAVSNDLQNLVFVPTQGQVPIGQSLTTRFTISDTDTDGLNITDNSTSVVTTAVAAPTISNTVAGQPATDHGPIMPFADVVIADTNAGQTETVTVTLSTTANGTLSNPGHGRYDPATGIYTDVGSAAAVTGDLDGLVFIPTQAEVAVGQPVITGFTISDSDTNGASASDSTTSVVVIDVASPTISNTLAGQAVTDHTTIAPFALTVIADDNAEQTEFVTVRLSTPANGILSNLGSGRYNATTGVYTDSGSAASVTSDLNALLFIPTAGQIGLGGTVATGFTVSDSDSVGTSATDSATSVVATAVAVPTISNTAAGQAVSDHATISPFAGMTIADANPGQTEFVTVTLSAPANGTLTNLGAGSYDPRTGIYSDSGSAAAVSNDLKALLFNPAAGEVGVGQTVTTGFIITDTDTVGSSKTDSTTSVIATAIAAPIIRNTVPNQAVSDQSTIAPFSDVVVSDANSGQTETVTVTLSAPANGSLTHLGSNGSYSGGVYTDHGTAAAVTADLNGLLFIPTKAQAGLGQSVTTGFTIQIADTAGFAVTESTTSVVATAATPPTIGNTAANQAVADQATIKPFSKVVIADANPGQAESVTVTLSNPTNGTLTQLGSGRYDATTGIYTDTGSAAAVCLDLNGLVFVPTQNKVALGQTVATGFTITVADTAGLSATDSSTSVIATAAAVPTISNTAANQAVTDHATISPFKAVVLRDQNPAQTETVTVMLSNPANGTLTNLSGGSYDPAAGLYTVTGSAATVSGALAGLIFTPTAAEVGVGQTVITGFIISDIDTAGLVVTDSATSVVATAVIPPIISNTVASQAVTDQTTIEPFADVVIGEFNAEQIETLTVVVSAPGNGILTNLGSGSYDPNTGVFSDSGSAADVTADLDGLVFTPTPGLAGIGQTVTTRFTISDTDSLGLGVTDGMTSVIAVGFKAPTISNTVSNQAVTDQTTIRPFSAVVIADSNAGQTESVTVTLSAPANGTLTNPGNGSYDPKAGSYTDTGSVAAVNADLNALVFNPTPRQVAPGQSVITVFTITDSDTALASAADYATSVIATAGTVSPTISGAIANQTVAATATIVPFANVVIADLNLGQTETVTVRLSSSANGGLANLGSGHYDAASGTYTDNGSAAAISADLEGLVFQPNPHQVAPGQSVTTVFTIIDTDTALASASNTTTSVIATAGTLAPTITGAVLSPQAVISPGSITPFAGVVIGDLNFGQTESVTVTLSSAANGTLTNLGNGSYSAGRYTVSGSAQAVTTAVDGLVFTPTPQQVAPGQSVTTGFTISVTDTALAHAADSATSVIATAGTLGPTIAGAVAGQAVTAPATIRPFSGVVIGDPNLGQIESVTVRLSAAANGTLTNLSGGTYNAGVYTVSGSAAAVSTALQGLVFTPTAQQVAPGQSVTTVFTISDTDTASASTSNSSASVIATAGTLAPTITGTASATQTLTTPGTVMPFQNVVIADLNVGETETLTVALPSANGTLTNLGGGQYDINTGVYTDVGSATAITDDLDGWVFTPTPHQVAPGRTVTTVFTISDTDTASARSINSATTVIATAGTVLPTISGAVAGQAATAPGTITPLAGLVIDDLNFGQVETVTLVLSSPANGTLTNLGRGTYNAGTYTVTDTAAAVTGALQGLVFTPTPYQVTPGQSVATSFTINDIDTASARAASATASVIATAGTIAPTITGAAAGQTLIASGTITPFSSVVIGEVNLGQTETVTVMLSSADNGTLTNLGGFNYNAATGAYTMAGSAAAVTNALCGLVFDPTAHQVAPGETVATVFTVTDVDTASASVSDSTTSVIAVADTVAPTITGTRAGQTVAVSETITPFLGVTIEDLNFGQVGTLTVTLSSPANGTLTSLGGLNYNQATGAYTMTGSAAALTAALDGLVFNPMAQQVTPGQTVTTVFTISEIDTASAHASDSTTSVIATVNTVAPTIGGAIAGQTVATPGTILPFAGVVIGDLNVGQTETVTVTLSLAANGFLTNLGGGSYDPKQGVFTDRGSAAVVTADLQHLTFMPTASLVANGQTVTTAFTVRDTDTASAKASDATTSVIATAGIGANPASDILLQNNQGQLALWQINGATIQAAGLIGPALGPSWFAFGAGAFYLGDTSDIVLQRQDGAVVTWQVQGTNLIGGSFLAANPGPTWHLKGTGDFYGDGATDILLQNDDGSVAVWETKGSAFVNAGIVSNPSGSVANPGPAWHVEGTGDFYHDGKTDILLQGDEGQTAIWEVKGTTIAQAGFVADPGANWHIKGTGDFYSDGKTDILLQNDNGPVAIWEMDGTAIHQAGFATLDGSTVADPGPTWHVQGTGDFNHAGKTAIVLQNDTGDVAEWQLQGTTVVAGVPLASPGSSWGIFGGGETMRFINSTGPNETLAATPTTPEEFVFTNLAPGLHTITGFSAIQDVIELRAAWFPALFTSVQQAITPIPGGAMINLGNAALLLPGVDPGSLHASNFALT